MWLSIQAGVFIFGLRILDITMYTLRLQMVTRGRKGLAAIFAFCQSLIFVTAIRAVLTNLDDLYITIGYVAGFATGLVVGMTLESRLAIGYTHLRIYSTSRGSQIAEQLRAEGYGITEVAGRGKDGMVTLLNCAVFRRDAEKVTGLVESIDPHSFISAEAVRTTTKGFWPISRSG